ncbi:hypothetical protein [uncultured Acinetobacter sp.]|uniref:hypothetical protein n=1 Tax=uncultured Acinetobacter sp. TaxID=165433 RepID=UPI00258A0225|nr:hypothetical protein [uncultured Acinetobacter sp.]
MSANHRKELVKALEDDVYDVTDNGIYFPKQGILAVGEYFHRVNDQEWEISLNKLTTEGLTHLLNVGLGSKAKAAGYYLALFSGSTAPADNWTAANFASVASEIVSLTEGYTNATRPQWVPADATTNSIDNMGTVAQLTIATSSQLNVTGSALLTNPTRGGTTGVLVSATKYTAARTFQDGDIFSVGYRISLSN